MKTKKLKLLQNRDFLHKNLNFAKSEYENFYFEQSLENREIYFSKTLWSVVSFTKKKSELLDVDCRVRKTKAITRGKLVNW